MDASHTVPQPAIKLEDFLLAHNDGAPAAQAETTQNLDSNDFSESHMALGSVGVDVPGVGHVLPDEPLDPTHHGLMDARPFYRETARALAVQRLLTAAENLARKNLGYRADWLITGEMIFGCNECGKGQATSAQGIAHKDTCNTGRVLRLVREFSEVLQNNPEEKEAVPERGTSVAEPRREDGVDARGYVGDGIRARGFFDEPWRIEGYKDWNLGSNEATFFIGVGDGIAHQVYELKGTLPNARFSLERMIACVNACAGIPTAKLDDVSRIFEANPAYFSIVKQGGAR